MKGQKLLYGASVLMVLGFFVHTGIDYLQYDPAVTAAPFRVMIYVNLMLWFIPAGIAFTAGMIAGRKLVKKEKRK